MAALVRFVGMLRAKTQNLFFHKVFLKAFAMHVAVLIWAVPSPIRPDAEIQRTYLAAEEDSQCTARSRREQVAEQYPLRLSKKSNTEAAVRRRICLRIDCSNGGLRDDSAGASEMALDTCNCRRELWC